MEGFQLHTAFTREFSGSHTALQDYIAHCVLVLEHTLGADVVYRPANDPESAPPDPSQDTPLRHHIQSSDGSILGWLESSGIGGRRAAEQRLVTAMARHISANIGVLYRAGNATCPLESALVDTLIHQRFTQMFQPILRVSDMHRVGFEALTRFPNMAGMTTPEVFGSAQAAGLGIHFEIQTALRIVARTQDTLAQHGFIALNLSHETLLMQTVETLYEWGCEGLPRDGYIIEISEQNAIENFDRLRDVMRRMRGVGLRLAIDDVGAGQAGLRHILQLEPDMIKVDRSVTAGVVGHKQSRAMLSALTHFGAQSDCDIVCEGVETAEELRIVRDLQVPYAQGFFLGYPAPLPLPQGDTPALATA